MAKEKQNPEVNSLVPVNVSVPENQEAYVQDAQVEANDFLVPALKVTQGMSDEVKAGKCRPGKFWDPYQQKEIDPPLRAIVVFYHKTRYKRADQGTEMCMSMDMIEGTRYGECKECEFAKWTDKPPLCAQSHCFVMMSENGPLVLRMRKKSEKTAKQFITQKQTSQQNWWAFPVVLDIKVEHGQDAGGRPADYFAPTITWDKTQPTPEELRKMARSYNAMLAEAQAAGRLQQEPVEGDGDA